jgi:hypothetical protein
MPHGHSLCCQVTGGLHSKLPLASVPSPLRDVWRPRLGGRARQNKTLQVVIRTLVVVGVGMIMGDGVLTPAVSVVSAVEGLAVASPSSFVPGDGAGRMSS